MHECTDAMTDAHLAFLTSPTGFNPCPGLCHIRSPQLSMSFVCRSGVKTAFLVISIVLLLAPFSLNPVPTLRALTVRHVSSEESRYLGRFFTKLR